MPRTPSIFVLSLLLLATTHTAFAATTIPGGTLQGDSTWDAAHSPYSITGTLTIPTGKTLILEPGTIVKVSPEVPPFIVEGTLVSGRDNDDTVTITSLYDDGVGGDSNEDGSTTVPHPGDWRTISVNGGGVAIITNTTIRYGGASLYAPWMGGYLPRPSLENNGGALSLTNVLLSESGNNGIEQISGSTTITNSTFSIITQKGILATGGALVIASSTFTGMTEGVSITGGSLTITGNTFHQLSTGIALSLEGTLHSFTNNGGNRGDGVISLGLLLPSTFTLSPDGLPYSPRYLDVGVGKTLTILPGATIAMRPDSLFRVSGGKLNVGSTTAPLPVLITASTEYEGLLPPAPGDWTSIIIDPGSRVSIANTLIRYGGASTYNGQLGGILYRGALQNDGGILTIASTTLSDNQGYAIFQSSGTTTIATSTITRARTGISVTGGVLTIHTSTIAGNTTSGVSGNSGATTDATHNWWGHSSGPHALFHPEGQGDAVSSFVDYVPWLNHDPALPPAPPSCSPHCYSNVLFLPGIQSSRLYRPDYNGGTNHLWEPNEKSDVPDLFMDTNGESVSPDVYTKDIIKKIFGVKGDVYNGFSTFMDDLKNRDTIADWASVPYDWRYAPETLNERGFRYSDGRTTFDKTLGVTSSPIITEELRRLASTSRTEKVTIIAHSYGGLVAKILLDRLSQNGETALVDKVILIGSPQLGTPKAIASMLHGDGQALLKGFLLDKPTAREFSENMPMAYTLLPSEKYFSIVHEPPVLIRNKASTALIYGTYGTSTDTYDEYARFLKGTDGRGKPNVNDWERPGTLSDTLLTRAKETHALLDTLTPPDGIEVIQIAGWGLDTIKGVRYDERHDVECDCNTITYVPVWTEDGDETVVAPSALAMSTSSASVTRYWVDLYGASGFYREKWKHSSMTEVIPIQELVKSVLLGSEYSSVYLMQTSPASTLPSKKLRYTLHSPLSLGLSDAEGRYTGLATSTLTTYPEVIEDIPNSYYMEFGETKIIGAPREGTTTLRMVGQSLGSFTLDVEEVENGTTTRTVSFPDLPVATGTIVSFQYRSIDPRLSMDLDGNGSVDLAITPAGVFEEDALILLRHHVLELDLEKKKEKRLLTIIDKIAKLLEKDFKTEERKRERMDRTLTRLEKRIDTYAKKGSITAAEKSELLEALRLLRRSVV